MSPTLQQLVAAMVRNSADLLRDSEGPMFPAFMLSKALPTISVLGEVDFWPLTDAVRTAREKARAIAKDMAGYVVAWDGYVRVGDDRTDAILMEAWEAPEPEPVLLAQRYRRDPFELVGPLVRMDAEA